MSIGFNMLDLFESYTKLPNFRGKNFVGQKLIKVFDLQKSPFRLQKMLMGFRLRLNLQDRMQSVIYIKRCHEPETEAVFKELARTSRVFLDIGANIGYFSFLVKQVSPQAQVHSFEPLPKNIESYKKIKSSILLLTCICTNCVCLIKPVRQSF